MKSVSNSGVTTNPKSKNGKTTKGRDDRKDSNGLKRSKSAKAPSASKTMKSKRVSNSEKAKGPDAQQMKRHLRLLHAGRSGPITCQAFSKDKSLGGKVLHLEGLDHVDADLQSLMDLNVGGRDVGVVPNVMDGKGRRRENCRAIRWLFVDGDTGRLTLKTLMALPVKPNLVVETSPGHLHPYWRVKGCTVPKFSAVQTALAARLGEDAAVSDPSRCMRLAGTMNHKRGRALARLVYPAPGKRRSKVHGLQEFVAAMELDIRGVSAEKSPTTKAHITQPEGDGKATSHAPSVMSARGDSRKLTETQVRLCLGVIDADPRKNWLAVGKALHSRWPDAVGYDMWSEWSAGSPKFDPDEQQRMWATFKVDGGTTIGTLVKLAREGLVVPGADEYAFGAAVAARARGLLGIDPEAKVWWRYENGVWSWSKGDHLPLKFVREYVNLLAHAHRPDSEARALRKVAVMRAAIAQAQLDDRLLVRAQDFDGDRELLGVANGLVNLATGEFRPSRPSDRVSKRAAVAFDADAKCPRFRQFLREVSDGRSRLRKYLVRALGYSLTGHTREQVLFMVLGQTQNGKGVLTNLMCSLLGDYAVPVSPSLLMRANDGNPNSPSPAIMHIRGAHMIICTELQAGKKLDEAFVKQITGGDRLVGRDGYGPQSVFEPRSKVWVTSNHDPEIAYGADAMWRRIQAVPFDVRFNGSKTDRDLGVKLLAEGPGILNLLLKSAKLYCARGLRSCPEVVKATEHLRGRLDSVQGWMDECCTVREDRSVQASKAYTSYQKHCKRSARPALSMPAFRSALLSKGITAKRRGNANYYWGLSLLDN